MAKSHFKKDPEIKLIKNDKNLVLVKVNSGKHLLGADPQNQPSQKQGTCWYYISNRLRPRLGKELEEKLNALKTKCESKQIVLSEKENQALNDLLKRRQIEKVISHYRKKLTKIDELEDHQQQISEMFKDQKAITKLNAKTYLEWIELCCSPSLEKKGMDSINGQKKLLEDFISSQDDTLQNYIDNLALTAAKATHEILKGFRKKEDYDHINRILELDGKETVDQLSFSEQLLLYRIAVRNECLELYGLKISTFNPLDGFEGLKNSLKTEGALYLSGNNGKPYYASKPTEGNYGEVPKAEYSVFSWPKETKRINHSASHAILVVGAEKIRTRNGLQETVLFMDPNDSSSPKEKDKIYRLSFNNFIDKIRNRYGYQGIKSINSAFGFFANQNDSYFVKEEFETIKPLLSAK
jgi:hypothetical protein